MTRDATTRARSARERTRKDMRPCRTIQPRARRRERRADVDVDVDDVDVGEGGATPRHETRAAASRMKAFTACRAWKISNSRSMQTSSDR